MTLRLRVSRPSLKAVRRGLGLGRRIIATVTVRVRDSNGNLRIARRAIRLRL